MRRGTTIATVLMPAAGHLLAAPAPAQGLRPAIPTYEQTVAALAACGVPAANVRISYEDDIQSDFISISDLGGTDEARLGCVNRAYHPSYLLVILDADQRGAYGEFAAREEQARYKAEAVRQLKTLGMLDRVPRYDPRKGLTAFAHGLEAACGVRAGLALETFGSAGLTFRLSFLGNFMATNSYDQFTCLGRMHAASNADEHGVILAFVGNAAATEGYR